MKVVIAAEDDRGLDGEVSAHFGRCPFYVCVEVNDGGVGEVEVVSNAHFGMHQPGIMPRFIQGLGADVIIAGGMGPRAIAMFQSMGIDVATGALGNVGKVLTAYIQGELSGTVPCAHDHEESCGGHGGGGGRGMGRG